MHRSLAESVSFPCLDFSLAKIASGCAHKDLDDHVDRRVVVIENHDHPTARPSVGAIDLRSDKGLTHTCWRELSNSLNLFYAGLTSGTPAKPRRLPGGRRAGG